MALAPLAKLLRLLLVTLAAHDSTVLHEADSSFLADRRMQAKCTWSYHSGKYSGGIAGGVTTEFSLTAARAKCYELGSDVCKAVTCDGLGSRCTVRRSSSLRTSPSGETTYVPSTKCFQVGGTTIAPVQTVAATCASVGATLIQGRPSNLLRVDCTGGCASGSYTVYGIGTYSSSSNVCAAAIHAGMFQSQIGGVATLRFHSPLDYSTVCFSSSIANGITSTSAQGDDFEGTVGMQRTQFDFIGGPLDGNVGCDDAPRLMESIKWYWVAAVLLGCCCCCCCFRFMARPKEEQELGRQKLLSAFGLRGRTSIPIYWENAGRNLELAQDRSNPEFFDELYPVDVEVKGSLQDLMNNTNISGRTDLPGFCVVRAVRVEDAVMWANYQKCTADIEETQGACEFKGQGSPITMSALEALHNNAAFAHNLDADVCEAYLWHSTSPEVAMKIAEDGFQVGLSKSRRFGAGGYFAEDPGKSDAYASAGQGLYADCYAMLLCRVVLGRQDHQTATSGPGRRSTSYDSLLAEPSGASREFVVYKDAQVYPEYAIVYERGDPHQYEGDYWDEETAETMSGSLPTYWHNNATVATGAFDEMYPAHKMKGVIQKMFDETWRDIFTRDRKGVDGQKIPHGDPNGDMPKGLTVCKVLRVEDSEMWAKYVNYQFTVRDSRGDECSSLDHADVKTTAALPWRERNRLAGDVNEVYLWHGSNPRAVMSIAEDGFNLDLSGSTTGQMFGKGAYFSECASKADEYSHDEENGYYKGYYAMLLCRVTLGEVQTLTAADAYAHTRLGPDQPFDSTLGDRESVVNTYREFVSMQKDGIYPEYAIIYERRYAKARVRGLDAPRWRQPVEGRPLYQAEDEYALE